MEARFAQDDLDAERTGVSHHRLKPGKRQPFGHKHEQAEEIYVVLGGSGRIKLDDEVIEVEPLDAIRVAPDVTRAFEAGPGGHRGPGCRRPPRRRRRDRPRLVERRLRLSARRSSRRAMRLPKAFGFSA